MQLKSVLYALMSISSFYFYCNLIYDIISICREKALTLYVFSKDSAVVDQILLRTTSGSACINDTMLHLAGSKKNDKFNVRDV